MEDLCICAYLKIREAKAAVKRFFSSESGGAGIIAAVILIVLVVILGIAFRETVTNLWNKLWDSLNGKQVENPNVNPRDF